MFILKFQAPRRHKSRYPATRPVVYVSVKCELVLETSVGGPFSIPPHPISLILHWT